MLNANAIDLTIFLFLYLNIYKNHHTPEANHLAQ